MSDSRSSPLARLLMGVVTLIAGAFAVRGAPAAAPVTAAGDAVAKSAAAAVAVVAEDTSPAAPAGEVPGRFDHMAARLLALSQHDTARYARIEAGDSTGVRFDRETLGVVVATLPDPDDSHEDWLFDAFMESIRRAHERRGYVIHRMWLPWALGADSVLKDAERTPVRAAYPGVLVFRAVNEGARPAWRIVLLVGEVPTAGPHPRALARALAERDGLVPPPADTLREDSLAVLGPSYSGSASGLRSALLGWASAGKRRVSIITASASSATVRGVFSDPHFTFGATINSDSALAYTLASSLIPRLGLRRDQLAVIAEGSTVYGQAVAAAAVDTSRPTAARSQAGSAQGAPLRLFFPLNIATLRAAPGAARSARPQAPGGAGVTLDLTDAPRPMEAPLTTSELTAPTVDIALDQIARTLRNHDIRAVAIAASDIRDRLFLVTQLRARLRDVRFIVLEGNQLYLAPQYNPDLRGTLVLSSYPLILESQLWGPPDNLVPFSDEYAQALYNAALIHLGDTAALVNYAVPDGRSGVRRPPVWTSVVGGSGLMPLSVGAARVGSARADEFARDEGTAPAVTATPDPRLDFLELSVVLGLLSLSLWLLWRNHRHLREVMREEKVTKKAVAAAALGTDAEIFRSAMQASLRSQEALYRFLLVVALAGGLLPPTVVICAAAFSVRTTNAKLAAAYALAAAFALLLAFVYGASTLGLQYGREYKLLARRRELVVAPDRSLPERLFAEIERALEWIAQPPPGQEGAREPATNLWVDLQRAFRDNTGRMLSFLTYAEARPDAPRKKRVWFAAIEGVENRIEGGLGRLARGNLRDPGAPATKPTPTARRSRTRVLEGWLRDMWMVNGAMRLLVLALGFFYLGATVVYARELALAARFEKVRFTLLFYRAWRADSGVSPLLPLGIAAATFLTWCGWHLKRTTALQKTTAFEAACLVHKEDVVLRSADDDIPDPTPGEFEHWEHVLNVPTVAGVRRVRERLFRVVPFPRAGWVALSIVVACCPIFLADDRTVEHLAGWTYFDLLYRFGLAGVVAVTAWGVLRLLVVWSALKRTLRAVGGTPLITAFERLPQRISRLTRLGFIGVPRSTAVAPVAAAQWRHLSRLARVLETSSPPQSPPLSADEEELRLEAIKYAAAAPPFAGLGACGDEANVGANFVVLDTVLKRFWEVEPAPAEVADVASQVKEEKGKRLSEPSTSGRFRRTFTADLGLWARAAEEFAAVHVADYVEWVISQLRTLAGFLFISVVLLTIHVNTYPFVPESLVKLLLFAILVITMVVVVMVMVEMNRDEVLSRIARTEPGKVSWDWQFVMNLLLFGLVPLLTLISSEFPGVRGFLFAWVPAISRLAGGG